MDAASHPAHLTNDKLNDQVSPETDQSCFVLLWSGYLVLERLAELR
jgi:hypothetical protein